MYVVVVPEEIAREAGGDLTQALGQIAEGTGRAGTYVIVAGRRIRALSSLLDRGQAGDLAADAIEGKDGNLQAILLDFVERVGEERNGGGDGDGAGAGGLILLGLLGAGGAALFVGRRKRRARNAAEFAEAKRNARDDLVALGDDIRALDVDVEMPNVDPQGKADYDHAVARYTEAEEQWDAARRPQDLAPVGSALEEGRWAMASAKARFAGETPPERRPPCFFDPRHGPSSRDVMWSPPYGEEREVPACEADAQRVERGDEPRAREVEWQGQRVPHWNAGPAYGPFAGGLYGGFGGGLLPGILIGSALGGSMYPGAAYGDWGSAAARAAGTSAAATSAAASAAATSAAAGTSAAAEAATSSSNSPLDELSTVCVLKSSSGGPIPPDRPPIGCGGCASRCSANGSTPTYRPLRPR